MHDTSMREFWDARAAEDPFYFVDNRQRYGGTDLERFWTGGRVALERIEELLGPHVSSRDVVVEIGCGLGRMTRALAERASRVLAIDVSERMLDRARELNPELDNVDWILGDGRSLGAVESESADVCQSFVVFQHIPDPEITLGYVREMGRVLRPGGWAAIQVSDEPGRHRRPRPAARLRLAVLAALGRAPRGQAHPAWLGSAIDLDRLAAVASEAGLLVERVAGAGTQHCLVLLRKRPARPSG